MIKTILVVSPEPVTLDQLTRSIAEVKKISPLFINVPEFALKIAIGEMSLMVLESTKASCRKLERSGYKFRYPKIIEALQAIYSRND